MGRVLLSQGDPQRAPLPLPPHEDIVTKQLSPSQEVDSQTPNLPAPSSWPSGLYKYDK